MSHWFKPRLAHLNVKQLQEVVTAFLFPYIQSTYKFRQKELAKSYQKQISLLGKSDIAVIDIPFSWWFINPAYKIQYYSQYKYRMGHLQKQYNHQE